MEEAEDWHINSDTNKDGPQTSTSLNRSKTWVLNDDFFISSTNIGDVAKTRTFLNGNRATYVLHLIWLCTTDRPSLSGCAVFSVCVTSCCHLNILMGLCNYKHTKRAHNHFFFQILPKFASCQLLLCDWMLLYTPHSEPSCFEKGEKHLKPLNFFFKLWHSR